MNGKKGEVECFLEDRGRWKVRVDGVPGVKLIKSGNIRVVQAKNFGKGSRMMVYDRHRSIQGFICPEDPNYDFIATEVRNKGVFGAKGYFWAIKTSEKAAVVLPASIKKAEDW